MEDYGFTASIISGNPQRGPIKELKNKGYGVTVDDFNQAIRKNEKEEIFALFLKAKIDLNSRDSAGVSPLWAAIESDNYSIAQLLVNKGVDINIVDSKGKSALELAVERSSLPILICSIVQVLPIRL